MEMGCVQRRLFILLMLLLLNIHRIDCFFGGRRKEVEGRSHKRNRGKHGGNVYHEHLHKPKPGQPGYDPNAPFTVYRPAVNAATSPDLASPPDIPNKIEAVSTPESLGPRPKVVSRAHSSEDFVEDNNEELESKEGIMEDFGSTGHEDREGDETVEEDEAGHKHGETRNNRSHRGHFNLRGATLLENGVKLVGGQGQNAVISASFDEVVHQQKGATTAVSSTQPIVAAPTAASAPVAVPETTAAPTEHTPTMVESVTSAVVNAEKAVEAAVTAPITAISNMLTSPYTPPEFPTTGVSGNSGEAAKTVTTVPGALPAALATPVAVPAASAIPVTPATPAMPAMLAASSVPIEQIAPDASTSSAAPVPVAAPVQPVAVVTPPASSLAAATAHHQVAAPVVINPAASVPMEQHQPQANVALAPVATVPVPVEQQAVPIAAPQPSAQTALIVAPQPSLAIPSLGATASSALAAVVQ